MDMNERGKIRTSANNCIGHLVEPILLFNTQNVSSKVNSTHKMTQLYHLLKERLHEYRQILCIIWSFSSVVVRGILRL